MAFWIIVSILLLLAVMLVTYAVTRNVTGLADAHEQRIARNVKLYRQRLAAYREELGQNLLSQESYDSLANELSRQLLNDVSELEKSPVSSRFRQRWLLFLLPAPLLALLIYAAIGAYPDWLITQALIDLGNSETAEEYEARADVIKDLVEGRIQVKPENIDYRGLLGRFAMGKRDYEEAALHYGILAELLPEDDEALALFAQAEFLRNGRKITPPVAHAMESALAINPQQVTVLGMQGIHALESGDLAAAVNAWEKLLEALPTESEQAQLIAQAIEKAREQLGQKGETGKPASGKLAAGIVIKVSVDSAVTGLDGNLPVFVYARAADGPPMPLAVKKIRLRDLPSEVRLDDSMAMMPEMRLSDFDKVVIGARISLSGQAVATQGDWQGETPAIVWKKTPAARVLISSQVK